MEPEGLVALKNLGQLDNAGISIQRLLLYRYH